MPGTPLRFADKYKRNGIGVMLLFDNPVDGYRRVGCRDNRTRHYWDRGEEVRRLLEVVYWILGVACFSVILHRVVYRAWAHSRCQYRAVPTDVEVVALSVAGSNAVFERHFSSKQTQPAMAMATASLPVIRPELFESVFVTRPPA